MTTRPSFSYNDSQFRSLYPAFANQTAYPAVNVQVYFDTAGLYITNSTYGPLAQAGATLLCLYLMTAHILQLANQIATGQDSGITISATIDKISTVIQQFQYQNQWAYWLSSTEYGKQLYALLQVQSVGGYFIPGGIGRAGFRY